MIDDDFDFDQPVTRIPQNEQRNKQLGSQILKEAEQYLEAISADEHAFLIQTLNGLVENEEYFNEVINECYINYMNKDIHTKKLIDK